MLSGHSALLLNMTSIEWDSISSYLENWSCIDEVGKCSTLTEDYSCVRDIFNIEGSHSSTFEPTPDYS
ncbi:hypothetical protein Bhyg_09381, partial [Pseudolycoriella hygida]